MEKQVENRLFYLDLLKAVAILMVISLHTGLWNFQYYSQENVSVAQWLQFFMRLIAEGVPIFFLVNGCLLFSKPFEWERHKKRIGKIIFYFSFWTIIQVLNMMQRNGDFTISDFFKHLISGDYSGTLWFYKTLVFLYLIFPVLSLAYQRERKIFYICFYSILVFTVVPRFFSNFDCMLDYWHLGMMKGLTRFLCDFYPLESRGSAALLFFIMGGILHDKENEISRKWKFWSFMGILSWIMQATWFSYISVIRNTTHAAFWFGNITEVMFCIGLFAICMKIKPRKTTEKVVATIGRNTNGVYVIHTILISRIANPFSAYHFGGFIGRVGYLMMIFCLSMMLTLVITRIPYIKKAIY